MKEFYKSLIFSAVFLVGCGSTPTDSTVDESTMVTRVHLAKQCLASKAELESFGSAVALALVPPLVESGVKAIGAAIKKAGEAEPFTTSHLTTMGFYTLNTDLVSFANNKNASCLIVYRAKIGDAGVGEDFQKSVEFGGIADDLYRRYRIVEVPKFYYEARIRPSNDRSAFMLDPQFAFYGESLGVKKKVKELVLTLDFAKPSSQSGGKTFATQSITFKRSKGRLIIDEPKLLAGYASGYMNLPSISKPATEALTLYSIQVSQLEQFKKQLAVLDQVEDPEVAKLTKELAQAKTIKASKLADALSALEHAKNDGESEEKIRELQRTVNAIVKDEAEGLNIANLEQAISARRGALAATGQRVNLSRSVSKLESNISRSRQLLIESTPVNVTAVLVETSNANKFLIALGSAIEGASTTAKTKTTEALTQEDPQTKLDEDVALLTKLNGLREKAISSVEQWRLAQMAFDSASGADKISAHSALRLKYFQAKLDCNVVELNSVVEPACFVLQAPPILD